MQTILLSEQDSEQIQPTMSVGGHVGNLFLGLFLGLLVLILDRRRGVEQLPQQQTNRWARSTLFLVGAILVILLIIVFLIGP